MSNFNMHKSAPTDFTYKSQSQCLENIFLMAIAGKQNLTCLKNDKKKFYSFHQFLTKIR